jgi:hypothetical protein
MNFQSDDVTPATSSYPVRNTVTNKSSLTVDMIQLIYKKNLYLIQEFHSLFHTKICEYLWHFVTNLHIFKLRNCWLHVQPPSWMPTPCRFSATAYSIYSQLPSISGDHLLHPQPEDELRGWVTGIALPFLVLSLHYMPGRQSKQVTNGYRT